MCPFPPQRTVRPVQAWCYLEEQIMGVFVSLIVINRESWIPERDFLGCGPLRYGTLGWHW